MPTARSADTERADIAREKAELATARAHELDELTGIHVKRGLEPVHGTATAVPCNANADYEDIQRVLSEWSPAG